MVLANHLPAQQDWLAEYVAKAKAISGVKDEPEGENGKSALAQSKPGVLLLQSCPAWSRQNWPYAVLLPYPNPAWPDFPTSRPGQKMTIFTVNLLPMPELKRYIATSAHFLRSPNDVIRRPILPEDGICGCGCCLGIGPNNQCV